MFGPASIRYQRGNAQQSECQEKHADVQRIDDPKHQPERACGDGLRPYGDFNGHPDHREGHHPLEQAVAAVAHKSWTHFCVTGTGCLVVSLIARSSSAMRLFNCASASFGEYVPCISTSRVLAFVSMRPMRRSMPRR